MKKLQEACKSAPAWTFGPCGPCIFRFSLVWVRDRVRYGHISLDYFPSLRTINMYPMIFVKKRTSSRFATTPWRNAAPNSRVFIQVSAMLPWSSSCEQGSNVLAFTLVLLVLKRFWWRVVLVILMFVAWFLVDLLYFYCLPSTNIMFSLCVHAWS